MLYPPSKICSLLTPAPQYLLFQTHTGTTETRQMTLPAKIKYITFHDWYVVWQRPPPASSDT